MSIFQIIKHSGTSTTGIWEITETEEELYLKAYLNSSEIDFLKGVKSENRRREWLAVRCLLNEILEKPCTILYTDTGKPYLKEPEVFVSISHTAGFAAVAINAKEETGIDIQTKSHKLSRISHKFLSEGEFFGIAPSETDEKLILYWCAKEALYKVYGKKEVDFKAHLFIEPFDLKKEGEMIGAVKKDGFIKNYLLHYYLFEGIVMAMVKREI